MIVRVYQVIVKCDDIDPRKLWVGNLDEIVKGSADAIAEIVRDNLEDEHDMTSDVLVSVTHPPYGEEN